MARTTTIGRWAWGLGAAGCALALQGCMVGWRAGNVELAGTMHDAEAVPHAGIEVEWKLSRRHFENGLAFTPAGVPTIHGRPVELPRLQALERLGLVVVDVAPLPPAWRPPVAAVSSSTLVVSALDRASPLAHAGLRVGDAIERVGASSFVGPQPDLLEHAGRSRLEELAHLDLDHQEALALGARRPDGSVLELSAALPDELHDVTAWTVPGLVNYSGSATGAGLTVGPVGTLFAARGAVLTDDERFVDRSEWGLLFDLLFFQSETDLQTGETRSRLRLFYVFELGDDRYYTARKA